MASPSNEPPDQRAIVDVTAERLIDLVQSRDPALRASIEELASLLERSCKVRQGWNSAITYE